MSTGFSLSSVSALSKPWLLVVLFLTMTVLVIGQQLYRYMYNLYLHPLAHFPGPPLWAASRIPHELGLARGRIIRDLATLHDKYGEVVRVSPNALSFIHPDAWKDIYARKPGVPPFPKNLRFYAEFLDFNDAHSLLTAGDADHARQRRVLSPGFSEKGIGDQEPVVQTHAALLTQRLRERIHDRPTAGKVDISLWLNWTTFDVIGDLVFGESFGCLQKNELHPWVALFYGLERDATFITVARQFPWFNYIVERLLTALFMEKLYSHRKFTIEKIDRRFRSGSDRADLINIILKQDGTKREMSRDEIYSNAVLIILAGSETTSAAMAGCIYFLLQYPQVMHILKNEIHSRFAREDEITFQALSSLTYLTAVLDESLRLYPPAPILQSRVAPNGGAAVAGHFVPENTSVGVYQWTAYHSEKNFRDPHCFDPSRWLRNPRYIDDRPEVFKPFSTGNRDCIGKQLAYSEMRLILSRLIYNFNFELCVESQNWIDQKAYFAWQKGPLMVRLSERDSSSEVQIS